MRGHMMDPHTQFRNRMLVVLVIALLVIAVLAIKASAADAYMHANDCEWGARGQNGNDIEHDDNVHQAGVTYKNLGTYANTGSTVPQAQSALPWGNAVHYSDSVVYVYPKIADTIANPYTWSATVVVRCDGSDAAFHDATVQIG